MDGGGGGTFAGSVIFIYKLYSSCGTDISFLHQTSIAFPLFPSDRIFIMKAIIGFILSAIVLFSFIPKRQIRLQRKDTD